MRERDAMPELPRGEHVLLAIVARWLGRDRRTIMRLVRRKAIRGKKIGRFWYVMRTDAIALRNMEDEINAGSPSYGACGED